MTLKANVKILFCIAAIAAMAMVMFASFAQAQPSSVTTQATSVSTTTPNFVGNGTATSTYQFDNPVFSSGKIANMQTVDTATLYLQVAASSTATQYTVTPQVSNNNVDWYNIGSQGAASAGGAIAVSSSTSFTWTPGTVATTSMAFVLPLISTMHERVQISASGAAGAYYAEVDLKKNPSTP